MRAPVCVTFRTTQSMTEEAPRMTSAFLRMRERSSATTLSAATVLHDSSQDVGDHIGAGVNGKKERSGDEKIFRPCCAQATYQKFVEFLHSGELSQWLHMATVLDQSLLVQAKSAVAFRSKLVSRF